MKVLLYMLLGLFCGTVVQAQEGNTTEASVKKWLKEKYTAFYASRAKDPAVRQFLLLYDKLDKEGLLCTAKVRPGLEVVAKRTSEETVLINWEASTNLDVVGYILERSLGKNAPYERVSYLGVDASQAYQFVDNNSSAEKSTYRVVQVMALGKNIEKKAEAEGYDTDLTVTAYPNPSAGHFTLSVQSRVNDPLQVRVVDVLGRVVEQRNSLPANQLVEIGAQYRPGIFFLQLRQGGKAKQLKLEKTPER
jgi:hypothetical protein